MDPINTHRRNQRRGNYSMLMGLTAVVVVGFAAFAVDISLITMAQLQAQATADAASHAALVAFREHQDTSEGNRAADFIVKVNKVAMGTAKIEGHVEYGFWDFEKIEGTFDEGRQPLNAVRVEVSRQGTNSVDLLLAPILGVFTHDVDARAVTAQQQRAVMLIQDMSCSMMPGTPNDPNAAVNISRLANRAFLDFLLEHPQQGDKLGLATFAQVAGNPALPGANPWGGGPDPWQPLVDVQDNSDQLFTSIDGICDTGVFGAVDLPPLGTPLGDNCLITGKPSPHVNSGNPNIECDGRRGGNPARCTFPQSDVGSCTNPAPALRQARDQLNASADKGFFRGIVFMSDGVPNCNAGGGGSEEDAIARATLEADNASADGISIWTILFHNGTFNPAFMGCDPTDTNGDGVPDNRGLTRGIGFCQSSPNAADLPGMYRQVAESLPTAFVQ